MSCMAGHGETSTGRNRGKRRSCSFTEQLEGLPPGAIPPTREAAHLKAAAARRSECRRGSEDEDTSSRRTSIREMVRETGRLKDAVLRAVPNLESSIKSPALKMYSKDAMSNHHSCSSLRHSKSPEGDRAMRKSNNGSSSSSPQGQRPPGGAPAPAAARGTSKRRSSCVGMAAAALTDAVASVKHETVDNITKNMFGERNASYAHSDVAATLLARRVRGEKLTWRERTFLFLDEPGSSTPSFFVGVILWSLLVVSALFSVCESIEVLQTEGGAVVFLFGKVIVNVVFTIEALLHVTTFTPLRDVYKSPIIWLDVLTLIPFWLRVILLPGTLWPDAYFMRVYYNPTGSAMSTTYSASQLDLFDAIRVLDSLTSLRLLKLARYYEGATLLFRGMAKSANQLLVPMFMLVIMLVCFSAVLVELEWDDDLQRCLMHWHDAGLSPEFLSAHPNGVTWDCVDVCAANTSAPATAADHSAASSTAEDWMAGVISGVDVAQLCLSCRGFPRGHPECLGLRWIQRYPNIPTAMWFMLVTVTPAVALDPTVYPQTWAGKSFIMIVIVTGVLFLAMPLSTIGANFNKVWEERQLIKLQRLVRQLLMENNISADDCVVAFQQIDRNGDGEIQYNEFTKFLSEVLGLQIPKRELKMLWRMIDENLSGAIDFREFADALFPNNTYAELEDGKSEASALPVAAAPPPSRKKSERWERPKEMDSNLSSSMRGLARSLTSGFQFPGAPTASGPKGDPSSQLPRPPSPVAAKTEPPPPLAAPSSKQRARVPSGELARNTHQLEEKIAATNIFTNARMDGMTQEIEKIASEQQAARTATDKQLEALTKQLGGMATMLADMHASSESVGREGSVRRVLSGRFARRSASGTLHKKQSDDLSDGDIESFTKDNGDGSMSRKEPSKRRVSATRLSTDGGRNRACTSDGFLSKILPGHSQHNNLGPLQA